MSKLGKFVFLATSAPIGLLIGRATRPEQVVEAALSPAHAIYTYVLEAPGNSALSSAKWLQYEHSCSAQGGRWDYELHCCHTPSAPVPSHDAEDDEDGEPIATK